MNNDQETQPASGASLLTVGLGLRKPLKIGNVYRYKGYKNNGFRVVAMSLPGTSSDDGGLTGVAVKWLNKNGARGWYQFSSEKDFWAHMLFRNAVDHEYA